MTELSDELKDKLTKICLCKGISRFSIKRSIKEGASTVAEVCRVTGAGTGSCGGKRCLPKIRELIEHAKQES